MSVAQMSDVPPDARVEAGQPRAGTPGRIRGLSGPAPVGARLKPCNQRPTRRGQGHAGAGRNSVASSGDFLATVATRYRQGTVCPHRRRISKPRWSGST
jgi:hypothetical protein